jgi:type IV secretion system protein VirB4
MNAFGSFLQSAELREALAPYMGQGSYSSLFGASEEDFELARWMTFEMETLMSNQRGAVPALLSYLFHRLESMFDGSPTLLILDEAWVFLDNALFAARIREWLKVLRKKNVYVVFASQSLADAMESTLAPTLIEACQTKIYLPNAQASAAQIRGYYERLGLNARQIQIIAQAQPKRDYYYQSKLGNRLFELGLGPVQLAFCAASSPDELAALRRIEASVERRERGQAWLAHKGLTTELGLVQGVERGKKGEHYA